MLTRTLTHWQTRGALTCLVAGWLLISDTTAPRADDPAATEIVEPSPRDAFLDPAFDLFVNQQMLEDAVVSGDAALLTDVALQVAHGEDVLQRPRQGVGAADLLPAAISAAADAGEKELLTRLQHGVTRYGKTDLEPVVAAALQLADAERKLEMPPGLDPSETTAESMVIYNAMAKEIRKALRYGSRTDVDDIIASLPSLPLHKKQQDQLAKLADQALLAINANAGDSPLALLASASRGVPTPGAVTSALYVRTIAGPDKLKYGADGKYTVILNRPLPKDATSEYTATFGYKFLSGPKSVTFKQGKNTAVITVTAAKFPAPIRSMFSGSIMTKLATQDVRITP